MKKTILAIAMAFLFFPGTVLAQDNGKEPTIKDTLALIRSGQHVASNDKINPDKVPNKLLEQLGDAVMAERFPNEKRHEWMDNMMGGEGSTSLAYMHRIMGYRFLQGYSGMPGYGFSGRGMMGGGGPSGGMMGGPGYYEDDPPAGGGGPGNDDPPYGLGYGMMGRGDGYGYGMRGGGLIWWIIGIVVVGGLVVAVVLLAVSRGRRGTFTTGETPLEILKKRLAKGEITKEEFDKLKHDVM